jgi:GT2 family glycosyltransferase
MRSKLAIVMPAWNNWHYTKRAIQQLMKLPEDHSVFVIDNGSTDDTKDLKETKRLHVRRNDENKGFARGCNYGYYVAKELGFENVLFLNNDIKVFGNPDSWTAPLIARAEKGSIVGPTVGCLDDNLNFICEAPKWPSRGHGYLSGWCICASTATWDKLVLESDLGPFSTEFGLAYFEDSDMGFRARELGIQSDVVPVPVKHLGKATSKKLGLSELYLHAKPIFLKKWGAK